MRHIENIKGEVMTDIGHYENKDYVTAIHEAGHAYTYCYFKIRCRIDTINVGRLIEGKAIPDQDDINMNMWEIENINDAENNLSKAIKIIMAILAGPIAENHFNRLNGGSANHESVIENDKVWNYAKKCCFGEHHKYLFVNWLIARTEVFIEYHFNWQNIKKLAEAVIKNKIIEYSEIKEFVDCRCVEI